MINRGAITLIQYDQPDGSNLTVGFQSSDGAGTVILTGRALAIELQRMTAKEYEEYMSKLRYARNSGFKRVSFRFDEKVSETRLELTQDQIIEHIKRSIATSTDPLAKAGEWLTLMTSTITEASRSE